jgi:glycerol-3-phosphate dehydrogenase
VVHLRHTLVSYLGQLNLPFVEQLSDWMGDALGWDAQQKRNEIERATNILASRHQVKLV